MQSSFRRPIPVGELGIGDAKRARSAIILDSCRGLQTVGSIRRGRALQLFRIESERLKLPAPFGRRIAEPLDADAAGQATFSRCFDKIGARKASEMVILTCRTLHFSRVQS